MQREGQARQVISVLFKGCRNGEGRCNGRGKQGKDALSVCAQGLCKDAKPTKHTQTLALRKARGIVRMQNKRNVH